MSCFTEEILRIIDTCSDEVFDTAYNYQQIKKAPIPEHLISLQIESKISLYCSDSTSTEMRKRIYKEIRHRVDIELEETENIGGALVDKSCDHVDWFDDALKDTSIKWDHWDYYKKKLLGNKPISAAKRIQFDKVNKETNRILSLLENPRREGCWDNRGLVVGDIQSGKTSNFIGLMAKAVDVGYKVFIVLTGTNNDLRKQTQFRVDDGLLGYSTKTEGINYFAKKHDKIGKAIHTLTSADDDGDYKKGSTKSFICMDGDDCILYVVKKNGSVLRNIFEDIQKQIGYSPDCRIPNTPLLVIDDEADNASLNTKDKSEKDPVTHKIIEKDDLNPTVINRYIRAILSSFDKSAYVGYTATPYANFFALPQHGKGTTIYDKKLERDIFVGEDLFPRNFIFRMETARNYFGPERIFGTEDEGDEGLPIAIKTDSEFEQDFTIIAPKTRNGEVKKVIKTNPESLKYAIDCFIISSIVKNLRNSRVKHNTMLIHIERFKHSHTEVKEWVDDYVNTIKGLYETGTLSKKLVFLKTLEQIWKAEYEPKTEMVIAKLGEEASRISRIEWSQVEKCVPDFLKKLEVRKINGDDPSKLDYEVYPNGLDVIVIGGDKLSRGLTLEGLSVSYFLRNSGTFDALSQMGRWFGYRDEYIDVCRLFSLNSTINNFREIAVALKDMNRQLDEMSKQPDKTPLDFGLRILKDPKSKILITSSTKSRNVFKHTVSFSGSPVPTAYLPKSDAVNEQNFNVIKRFIDEIDKESGVERNYGSSFRSGSNTQVKGKNETRYWKNVSSKDVQRLFLNSSFSLEQTNNWFSLREISEFVDKMNKFGEVTNWTVALMSGNGKPIEELKINSSERALEEKNESSYYELNRRRISSGTDEAFDLNEIQFKQALKETNEERKRKNKNDTDNPSPYYIRKNRDKKSALLLIYMLELQGRDNLYNRIFPGFMISFPELNHREMDHSFWANTVYADVEGRIKSAIYANEVGDES